MANYYKNAGVLIKLGLIVMLLNLAACDKVNLNSSSTNGTIIEFDIGTLANNQDFQTLATQRWQTGQWPVRCKVNIKQSSNENLAPASRRELEARVYGAGPNANARIVLTIGDIINADEKDTVCSLGIRSIEMTLTTGRGFQYNQPIPVTGDVIIDSKAYTVRDDFSELVLKEKTNGVSSGELKLIGLHSNNPDVILLLNRLWFKWAEE